MIGEPTICSGRGPWIAKGKRLILNLSGGDILGLTSNKEFATAFLQNLESADLYNCPFFFYESQSARIPPNKLYEIKGQRKALLFKDLTTLFNLLASHLLKRGYVLLVDEQFEMTNIPLIRNINNQVQIFPHNSFSTIRKHIEAQPDSNFAIFVQTVYPLSSELLPVNELLEISQSDHVLLIIYESWADGLLGEGGEGLKSLISTIPQNSIIVGSYSHILPLSFSYIASSETFIDALESDLKPHPFNPESTEFQVGITLWFINFLNSLKSPLRKLSDNANYLRYEFATKGFRVLGDFAPLIPVLVGEREKALEFYNGLLENKILANLLNYPLVPLGKSRILLIPSVLHSKEDLDFALNKLEKVAKTLGII